MIFSSVNRDRFIVRSFLTKLSVKLDEKAGEGQPAETEDATKIFAFPVRYLTAFFCTRALGDLSVGTRSVSCGASGRSSYCRKIASGGRSAFEGVGATAEVNAGLIEISSKWRHMAITAPNLRECLIGIRYRRPLLSKHVKR